VRELRVLGWGSLAATGLELPGAKEGAEFRGKVRAVVDQRRRRLEQGGAPRRRGSDTEHGRREA
jgi:hypothetical protein